MEKTHVLDRKTRMLIGCMYGVIVLMAVHVCSLFSNLDNNVKSVKAIIVLTGDMQ
jgi:hypothetical protein